MTSSTLISGKRGSGKSLLMILIAYYAKNYKDIYLNFPNSLENSKIVDIATILSNKLHNCYLFIDEAYLIIDSRNSQSKINKNFSYKLFQIRHTDIDLFVTTQLKRTLELRFLAEIDTIIECYRIPDNLFIQPEYFQYDFITENGKTTWFLPFNKAEFFFPFYDTKINIISENVTNQQLKIIKETNPKLFVEMSLEIAKEIYDKHSQESISHDQIILELQQLNKSELFEKNVFLLCKNWLKNEGKNEKKSKKRKTTKIKTI